MNEYYTAGYFANTKGLNYLKMSEDTNDYSTCNRRTSSGGEPLSFMCLLQELKLAASGCTYLAVGPVRWEWKMNLLGEKKRPQRVHLMHLALEEL